MPPITFDTLLKWAERLGVVLDPRTREAQQGELTVSRGEATFTVLVPMGCRGEKARMLWVLLLRTESYLHRYEQGYAAFAADPFHEAMGEDSKQRIWATIRTTADGMRAVLGDDLDAGLDIAREISRRAS